MAKKLSTRIRGKLVRVFLRLTDPVLYSRQYIRYLERQRSYPDEKRRISIAIPHYERADLIHVALKNAFGDERVSEIVILDDGSSPETLAKCAEVLGPFRSKVKLFWRRKNLGVLATKVQAAELCSNEWCVMLDSDNSILASYLDAIFAVDPWNEQTIYCPGYAFPNIDFRGYGELTLNFEGACALKRNDRHRLFAALISRGNYFINVKAFSEVLRPYRNLRCFADSALANYICLSEGFELRILSDASYYHRVHPGSNWTQHPEDSLAKLRIINERFKRGERATPENLPVLFREQRAPDRDEADAGLEIMEAVI